MFEAVVKLSDGRWIIAQGVERVLEELDEVDRVFKRGGVAIGYVSYELPSLFEERLRNIPRDPRWPPVLFVEPSRVEVVDKPPLRAVDACVSGPISMMVREQYLDGVLRVKQYLERGDVFQVVLSRWVEWSFRGDPYAAFRALISRFDARYVYYWRLGDSTIIGASPETLVNVVGRRVVSTPIAGTRPRGSTPEEDYRLERELVSSVKERAEHIMLVDLIRNDLGRVCRWGSVRVASLGEVWRLSYAMHLVSVIECELDRAGLGDLLAAMTPSGTMSGAPKFRAMEIIAELEGRARGPYAGGFGVVSKAFADLAVVIRTVTISGNVLTAWAGAGIVMDSDPDKEWAETEVKLGPARHIASTLSNGCK